MTDAPNVPLGGESRKVPLTPFERYMLEDDSEPYPMSFFLRLDVNPGFCTTCFRWAVYQLANVHPRFFATIVRHLGRPYWSLATTTPTISDHRFGEYDTSRSDWGFSVASESCLRISIGSSDERGEMWLQVHHCCCDARGSIQFLRAALMVYQHDHPRSSCQRGDCASTIASSCDANTSHAIIRDPRSGCSANRKEYMNPRSHHWNRIRAFYRHKAESLAPNAPDSALTTNPYRPTFASQRLPFSTAAWQGRRSASGATLNDGLLHSVFHALRNQVTKEHAGSKSILRIAVPIDQRGSHGHCDTAQNHSSMVFIDRFPDQIIAQNALKSIATETRLIKRFRLSTVFQDVLHILNRIPFAMRIVTQKSSRATTTVVSNLGILDELLDSNDARDNLTHSQLGDNCDFLVPIRRGTSAAFGIATFRRHIHLSLHYDARILKMSDAQTLLNDTCRYLHQFILNELSSDDGTRRELYRDMDQ